MNFSIDLSSEIAILKLAKKVAIFTFVVGTLLLGLYYFSKSTTFIVLSLLYMLVAFIFNSLVVVKLFYFLFNKSKLKNKIQLTLLLLFLNIPIAYIYIQIGFKIFTDNYSETIVYN